MDRLLSLGGAQPLRSADWELIQNVEKALLKAILTGLLPEETSFIVCGMVLTVNTNVDVTEGWFFDGDEICYVPASSFVAHDEGYGLYLVPDITTSENRTFKDTTTHNVWELRRYEMAYESSQPGGSIAFNSIPLIGKLTSLILSQITLNSNLLNLYTLSYLTGFGAATGLDGLKLEKNTMGWYMLLGAFNATVTAGKITTLPSGHRPSGDLVAPFFNDSVTPGVLKIKKNGDVYVSGASITATNYISFQYLINFQDPVNWGLPTSGGSAPPEGDA
ncbi:MAG: hypothetical protein NTU51_05870 [Bacteroidetes bacterium]|nr:hypothetical protein [Bacteroidota bacterium]